MKPETKEIMDSYPIESIENMLTELKEGLMNGYTEMWYGTPTEKSIIDVEHYLDNRKGDLCLCHQ